MKTHTGLFELIIIFVFIVAGVPLLLSLVMVCSRSKFRYLDDKTVYKMSDSVEYVVSTDVHGNEQLVPVNLAPIGLDFSATQLIALIQDDYCPVEGMRVDVKPTANTCWGTYRAGGVETVVDTLYRTGYPATNTLTITRGWYAKRYDEFESLKNLLSPYDKLGQYYNDKFYLVWNSDTDSWMITHEFINIYEER